MFTNKIDSYKSSFTLIEIILVVFIISIVYGIFISNINKKVTHINNITLQNLKTNLQKLSLGNKIEIKCINNGELCYIFIDDKLQKQTIKNLFKTKPIVYNYDDKLDIKEFARLNLEKFESYDVCFEYKIDKYQKSDDMIVEANNKVYIFNSIKQNPIVVDDLASVSDYFDAKKQELKDAF